MSNAAPNISQWCLPVASQAVWDARIETTKPELSFVEPMLRRRLSPLARAAFHVAHACGGHLTGVPLVYASRHGELGRTLELFQSLASGETLSPTTFSLSVLNANAGLYSITRGDTSPATAISAGTESFGFGLLEALSRSLSNNTQVLYVYAEAPAPEPLGPCAADVSNVLAIGLLIDPDATQTITCEMAMESGAPALRPQAEAFLDLSQSNASSSWTNGQRLWRWSH